MAAARGDAGTFTVGYIPRRSPGEGLLRFLRQPETIAVGSRHRPGAASGPALLGRAGFYLWVQARHADAKVLEERVLAIDEATRSARTAPPGEQQDT